MRFSERESAVNQNPARSSRYTGFVACKVVGFGMEALDSGWYLILEPLQDEYL